MSSEPKQALDLDAIRERMMNDVRCAKSGKYDREAFLASVQDRTDTLAEIERLRAAIERVRKECAIREKSEYGVEFDAGYETALDNVQAALAADQA